MVEIRCPATFLSQYRRSTIQIYVCMVPVSPRSAYRVGERPRVLIPFKRPPPTGGIVVTMDTRGWRARISRCFDRPPPCQQIDREIRDLGGTTSAFDCMEDEIQAEKGDISVEEHTAALEEDIRRLKCERDYYHHLIQDVLIPLTPRILFHTEALCAAAQRCDVELKRTVARSELERGQTAEVEKLNRQTRRFLKDGQRG